MKKKLFTLLTLALCVCSGAWAEDEILYQFTMTATADVTMAASTTGNVDLVTNEKATLGVAGTAVEYFQGQSGSSEVKYIEAKKQDKVQSTNLRFTSNASYLKITLAAGETLQAGDIYIMEFMEQCIFYRVELYKNFYTCNYTSNDE